MSRTASYGQSFAMKHLNEGHLEEALAECEKGIAADGDDPEPVLDRAQVYLAMNRFEEVIADVKKAIELDKVAQIADDAVIDDTLFSALIGWGQAMGGGEKAAALVEEYKKLLPKGVHLDDSAEWARRFRGHKETWVKAR